jgi:hypothetical protein
MPDGHDNHAPDQRSDRSQTMTPPAMPLPPPETLTDKELDDRVKQARRCDPTAPTGTAG